MAPSTNNGPRSHDFMPSSPSSIISAASSTLVVTPHLHPKKHHRMEPKGPLGPHVSNLPRRRTSRNTTTPAAVVAPPPPPPVAKPTPLPLALRVPKPPPLQMPPRPAPIPSSSQRQKGPLAPHVTNLPRRRTTKRDLARKRRLQEIIPGSGVWVCFTATTTTTDDDDEKEGYDRVVRIVEDAATKEKGEKGKEERELVLRVPKEAIGDTGLPNVSSTQLRQAWSFLRSSSSKTLIATTPGRAVDAVAVAIGYLCLSGGHERTSEAIDTEVLGLLSRIQDLGEDDMHESWRGVLSSEGVEWLDRVLVEEEWREQT